MRDRLIELLGDYLYSDQIADHLLKNGVVVPPCKTGDIVYVAFKGGEYYWQSEVLAVWIRQDKVETDTTVTVKFQDGTIDTFYSEEIYISKEEAEKALRKEDEGK